MLLTLLNNTTSVLTHKEPAMFGGQHAQHKPWITPEILRVIEFRDYMYKMSRARPKPELINLYKKVSFNTILT